MDILFVVPYVPSVVRTRPYNLIRHLSRRGHRVTVFTLWTTEEELNDVRQLREHCHQVRAWRMHRWRSLFNLLRALPGKEPLQSAFSWQPALVNSLNGGFDVTHVEHLRGARYGLYLKAQNRTPVVWDSVDCISHLFEQAAHRSESRNGRWMTRFELNRTRQYEARLARCFNQVLLSSAADRQALLALQPQESDRPPISLLPNGVDLDYFQPDSSVIREPATIVVSGKMSYHANISMVVHLVRNIMPRVWQQAPEAKVIVAGKDPAREIMVLAQDERVNVTGTVPDMRRYLRQATIAAAPITYGAGIQNKVLEAMACGTPVVASRQAISALAVRPGADLLVAEDAAGQATAILDLLNDLERRRQVGEAGRHYVQTHHNWHEIAGQLEDIYREVINQFN